MMSDVKLTSQETNVIAFLATKSDGPIHWEELAQFAKDPQTVKLKTIQKVISDLKKKYLVAGVAFPYNGKFSALNPSKEEPKVPQTIGDLIKEKLAEKQEQTLVQIKRTPAGTLVKVDSTDGAKPMAQVDFVLDPNTRRVRTRYGFHLLNEREWDVMKYLHANVGRVIAISELRDKVVYEKYGSKLPPRWFDHIKAIIGNLRAQVPGLRDRVLTVKGIETSYLFQ
jgi:hypothetical protein